MSLILNIESSSTNCSVSIAKEGVCIVSKELNEGYSHAENLLAFVKEILDKSLININDLTAVAVSAGPGSYTGLRIGVSAAKGLCFGLNIPLIAIDSLSVIVKHVLTNYTFKNNDLLIPLFDARRMEVYTAIVDSAFNFLEPISAKIIDEHSFSTLSSDKTIYFFGDGAMKCKPIFNNRPNFKMLDNIMPSAVDMAKLSYQNFLKNKFEDVAYFEPFYLKEFHTNAKIL